MTDHDRDREPIPERRRTTVIDTSGRSGGGGGGAIGLILLLIIVVGVAWFLMRSGGSSSATKVGVNVSLPKTPDINVKIPDKIEVKTDKAASNGSR